MVHFDGLCRTLQNCTPLGHSDSTRLLDWWSGGYQHARGSILSPLDGIEQVNRGCHEIEGEAYGRMVRRQTQRCHSNNSVLAPVDLISKHCEKRKI